VTRVVIVAEHLLVALHARRLRLQFLHARLGGLPKALLLGMIRREFLDAVLGGLQRGDGGFDALAVEDDAIRHLCVRLRVAHRVPLAAARAALTWAP